MLMRLPEAGGDWTGFKTSQHGLGCGLGIARGLRGGAGRANHGSRLARQQFAIAWGLGIASGDTGRSFRRAGAGRTRTLCRVAFCGILWPSATIPMCRQTLVDLLLPGRRDGGVIRWWIECVKWLCG
jgi:hypothetical protein